MAEDNYSDGADTMTQEASAAKEPEKASEEPTALLPKSILAGKDFKPGEEVVLKVLRVMDDQVEVAYATGESDKESPAEDASGPGEEPMMPTPPPSNYD